MNWDQQEYSFGNPNAQPPPTPTRTPTSATFPSPNFQTPRNNPDTENRTGWTPVFAEEYTVFATPGRLTNSNPFLESSTPRPTAASIQDRRSSISGDTAHVSHFSPNPSLSLSAVDHSSQANISPTLYSSSKSQFDDSANNKVTPRQPKKRLEEAFSGQTATPPASASKGSRKLAPKLSKKTMQNDSRDGQYGSSQTPTQHQDLMAFPSTTSEFFSYPMSAPATAPAFNAKPFWDPETNLDGMDLDFTATDEAALFNTGAHKVNSFDWGRDSQIYQDSMALPTPTQTQHAPSQNEPQISARRQRPLAPKLPTTSAEPSTSMAPFDFSRQVSDDPFSSASMGGVDPGLLFAQNTSVNMTSSFAEVPLPAPRPSTSHVELRPYQHQLRESRRDQEELRLALNSRDGSKGRRYERGTVSSPIKGSSRPGLQRSVSDNRTRRTQDRVISRAGRVSPVKHQRLGSLTSIPELPPPRTRTEVKFTIDANGRARTETVIVEEEPRTTRGGPSSRDDDLQSDLYESSSDDDPIIIPSQNSSFALPQPGKVPKLARFDTSQVQDLRRRHSTSGYSHSESSSQRSGRHGSIESEAETVVDEDDGSADATLQLRKVVEERKKRQMMSRNPRHHLYVPGPNSRGNAQYAYSSSTNISPTTITDPDGATPSSSRSGSTRCICNIPESEGFMIQCDACENWLHAECVGIDRRSLPPVYVCAYCAQTPNMRGGRLRDTARATGVTHVGSSPLAHKSFKSFR